MSDCPGSLLTEAVLEAMPIGVAVVDADKRIVLFNAAYCASLDLPPNSFPPGMLVADALRVSAYRGVYGPGDPEAQVAAFLATDRSRAGRLRRRTFNGRSFDVLQAPLPDGGYVVCAVETTALVAARTECGKRAGTDQRSAGHAAYRPRRVRPGPQRCCSPIRVSANCSACRRTSRSPASRFAALLDLMAAREEFAGMRRRGFHRRPARGIDRSRPSTTRRIRADGQVIDIISDPLPGRRLDDGGHRHQPARPAPRTRRAAAPRMLDSIVDAVPHGVCVYGADRRVTMFNRAYTDVMAGAPLQFGDHLQDVIRRRAAAGEYGAGDPEEIFAQQMAFDVTRPQSRKRRRPNGMTVDVRTSPLPDGGYISVVTDITPLTAAEAEISRRAEEMAVMLSCIRHGVMLWGPDRRLLASNAIAS